MAYSDELTTDNHLWIHSFQGPVGSGAISYYSILEKQDKGIVEPQVLRRKEYGSLVIHLLVTRLGASPKTPIWTDFIYFL